MALVFKEYVKELCNKFDVEIAGYLAPDIITISGKAENCDAFERFVNVRESKI